MRAKAWMIFILLLSLCSIVLGVIVLVTIPEREISTALLLAQGIVLILVGIKFLISLIRTSKQNQFPFS